MAFCGNCGYQLNNGESFCPNCGRPVVNVPQVQQPQQQYVNQVQQRQSSGAPLPPMPETHMALAIVATAFGCFPLGIYAIILANRVESYYFARRYAEAEQTSRKVKIWSICGIIFSIVFAVLYIVLCFVIGFASGLD